MADRAKHAFGSSANLEAALQSGAIDSFDILFLDGDTDNPKIGWVGKDGKPIILKDEKADLTEIEAEVAKKADAEDVTQLESEVAEKADADEVENSYKKIKYEIISTPEGTLVNYGENEIRVMCPADTKWVKQTVGETGNASMYYMGFKAYAPEGAVSFKEGDRGVIVDKMHTFDDDFAGTDKFGRKYSICWLALASYDESTDTWTYFGKNSTKAKYIGWDYIVEWYNADGVVIASDSIRIGLSNEDCHYVTEPYYVGKMMSEIDKKIAEATAIEVVEF